MYAPRLNLHMRGYGYTVYATYNVMCDPTVETVDEFLRNAKIIVYANHSPCGTQQYHFFYGSKEITQSGFNMLSLYGIAAGDSIDVYEECLVASIVYKTTTVWNNEPTIEKTIHVPRITPVNRVEKLIATDSIYKSYITEKGTLFGGTDPVDTYLKDHTKPLILIPFVTQSLLEQTNILNK